MDLDEVLRRFVVLGDGTAMDDLVRATRPALLRVARRIGAPQDADDAVQAAYLALVRRAAKPTDAPVLPWLLTAVVRIAYRNKAVAKRRVAAAKRLSDWTEATPLDETIRQDEALALRHEVTRLPADYRDALVLHYLEGLSVEEVAALLEISPSAVKMRLLRGRALLRSRLGVRLGHSFLWLPWLVADARASVLGGMVMKKAAVIGALLLIAGTTTFMVVRHPGRAGAAQRSAPHARDAVAAAEPIAGTDALGETVAPSSVAQGAVLSGRVVDETGAPVPDVGVFVRQYREDPSGIGTRSLPFFYPYEEEPEARTDADGRFAIAREIPRLWSVCFVKAGRVAIEQRFGGTGATGLEIVAGPGTSAAGVVSDTERRPIPGARVHIAGVSVHADDAGRYALDVLPRPPWQRGASAPGYEGLEETSARDGDIRLRRNTIIVEPLDERTGARLPNVGGLLCRAGSGQQIGSLVAKLGPDLPDLRYPPGRLYPHGRLEMTRDGRAEIDVHVFAPGYVPQVHRASLAADVEPPHLRIEMSPGDAEPVLSGRIEGASLASVEIQQSDESGVGWKFDARPVLQRLETRDGTFAFAGLPAGTHRVIVRARGMGTVATDVVVPARDVVVRLESTASLVVTGTGPDGTPAPGEWIHVESAASGEVWEQRTDVDGRATFPDVSAGRVALTPARLDGWAARHQEVPVEEFELPPGGRREIRVEIPVAREFVLTAVGVKEEPVPGVPVTLRVRGGFARVFQGHPSFKLEATTDARGEARFDLRPGTYEASIVHEGATVTTTFEAGESRSHRVVLGEAPVLRGQVVDEKTGDPVRQIRIVVVQGKAILGETLTDRDGRFAIACGNAGTASLMVLPRDGPAGVQWTGTPYPHFVQRDIDLASRGQGALHIALPKVRGEGAQLPVTFHTVATDAASGLPVEGATVEVMVLRGGFAMAAGAGAWTDKDGRAVLRVATGEAYRVQVRATGYDTQIDEQPGGPGEIRVGMALVRAAK